MLPTNRGNCQPQIHHHLQVHRQAYRTRPCRSIGEGTSSSSPRTYQTGLSRWQGSGSVLIDMALFVPPFILASRIVVTSATDTSDNPPHAVFENLWCLWDTGAQTSFIVTSQLGAAVRDNKTGGSAIMDISSASCSIIRDLQLCLLMVLYQLLGREPNHRFSHLLPPSA